MVCAHAADTRGTNLGGPPLPGKYEPCIPSPAGLNGRADPSGGGRPPGAMAARPGTEAAQRGCHASGACPPPAAAHRSSAGRWLGRAGGRAVEAVQRQPVAGGSSGHQAGCCTGATAWRWLTNQSTVQWPKHVQSSCQFKFQRSTRELQLAGGQRLPCTTRAAKAAVARCAAGHSSKHTGALFERLDLHLAPTSSS